MPVFLKLDGIKGELLEEGVLNGIKGSTYTLDGELRQVLTTLAELSGKDGLKFEADLKFLDFFDGKQRNGPEDKFLGAELTFDLGDLDRVREALSQGYEDIKIKYVIDEKDGSFLLKIDDIPGESKITGPDQSGFLKIGDIKGESLDGVFERYGLKLGDETEDLLNDIFKFATVKLEIDDIEFNFVRKGGEAFAKIEIEREDMAMFVKFDGVDGEAARDLGYKLGELSEAYDVKLDLVGSAGDYFLKIGDIKGESFEFDPIDGKYQLPVDYFDL